MSDPVEFPAGKRVYEIVLPVPAEMMEMLQLAQPEVERNTGMSFDSVGHFLAWHLWEAEEVGLKLLKKEPDWDDPVLAKFPENTPR